MQKIGIKTFHDKNDNNVDNVVPIEIKNSSKFDKKTLGYLKLYSNFDYNQLINEADNALNDLSNGPLNLNSLIRGKALLFELKKRVPNNNRGVFNALHEMNSQIDSQIKEILPYL